MRKILVTGALGQIGSELVLALRKRYELVVASDLRKIPDHPIAVHATTHPTAFYHCRWGQQEAKMQVFSWG